MNMKKINTVKVEKKNMINVKKNIQSMLKEKHMVNLKKKNHRTYATQEHIKYINYYGNYAW
jgi:hypothetical protein